MAARIESGQTKQENLNNLEEPAEDFKEYLNRIIIKDKSGIKILPVEDIIYLEAQDDYVMIHSNSGKYLKQKTMKYYESNLDPAVFVRIHRSYIININCIKNIELLEKDSYQAILKDGPKLSISKSGYSRLRELLN